MSARVGAALAPSLLVSARPLACCEDAMVVERGRLVLRFDND